MIRRISLLIIVSAGFICQSLFAQPDTLWTKTYGGTGADVGYSVQQTSDGGFIIAGYTSSFGAGSNDVWLIKTDASGDTLWTRTFGGSESDVGNSVCQTAEGGYIIAGKTASFGAGSNDVWLIKTDASGDTIWTKTFGGSEGEDVSKIQRTSDNGYVILGLTTSYGEGGWDIYLIKTDASGDTLWTKAYGGSNHELGASVQQTLDNGYVITGSTGSFGAGSEDAWLIKTDASGDTLWTKTFGGSEPDRVRSIQQTDDSGYIMTGYTNSFGAGSSDVWLIKTDASGDTLWTKTFGGSEQDQGYSVIQTSDGGYIITGSTKSFGAGSADVWLIRTDASGDTLWTKTFGGSEADYGPYFDQTTDQGYILAGYTKSYGMGEYDVWLIRIAPDVSTNVTEKGMNVPESFRLFQNYPNPFNPRTKISYSVSKTEHVSLTVYNVLGEKVETLVDETQTENIYTVDFKTSDLTSGTYFYVLKIGNSHVETKKMILIR